MPQDNDRWKALRFERPERIPVSMSILPATWMKYREDLDRIAVRHPVLFGSAGGKRDYDAVGDPKYLSGTQVDAWGCVWENVQQGMAAIVTGHPVPRREDVWTLKAPVENIGFPHGFMFLRLTDLRGFEEMMVDFAEAPPELQHLIDLVRDYNIRQARLRLEAMRPEPQIVGFGDDLGLQNSLPISPETWRRYLKPCYAAIYRPFVAAGHMVYMHTDGHILEIIPDLIDCGIRILNPQIRANGLEGLRSVAKGKVCINLDLDRQLFPFCSPEEVREHIRECVDVLGDPQGGLWLSAEIAPDVPLPTIEAICATLEEVSERFLP